MYNIQDYEEGWSFILDCSFAFEEVSAFTTCWIDVCLLDVHIVLWI